MLGKPHPEQDRVGGRPGPSGRARVVRPFPRVGRSIPRATGGPDEWLLSPLGERGNRTRLTDLLRRMRRRGPGGIGASAAHAARDPPRTGAPRTWKPHAALPRAARGPGGIGASAAHAARDPPRTGSEDVEAARCRFRRSRTARPTEGAHLIRAKPNP